MPASMEAMLAYVIVVSYLTERFTSLRASKSNVGQVCVPQKSRSTDGYETSNVRSDRQFIMFIVGYVIFGSLHLTEHTTVYETQNPSIDTPNYA